MPAPQRIQFNAVFWFVLYLSFTIPLVYLVTTRPPGFAGWLTLISVTQLIVGGLLTWWAAVPHLIRGPAPGWLVWVALGGLQAAEWSVIRHSLPRQLDLMVIVPAFVRYTVLIGLAEEIWFRGLWFRCCQNRFAPAVLGGAVLFGLYHLGSGWTSVLLTAAVGLLFGVLRHRGVSLVALALLHGAVDALNRAILPGQTWRFPLPAGAVLFVVLVVAVAGFLSVAGRRRASKGSIGKFT